VRLFTKVIILSFGNGLKYISADGNSFNSLSAFEHMKNLCFLSIRRNELDLNSAETRTSVIAIQAVIDANKQNPPAGYDPEWTKEPHAFHYSEQYM